MVVAMIVAGVGFLTITIREHKAIGGKACG
jgi:hypothetical protein